MLVLSRKLHEVICIGNDIRIIVVQCGLYKIRLGIEAPADIEVHREEVKLRIEGNHPFDEGDPGT